MPLFVTLQTSYLTERCISVFQIILRINFYAPNFIHPLIFIKSTDFFLFCKVETEVLCVTSMSDCLPGLKELYIFLQGYVFRDSAAAELVCRTNRTCTEYILHTLAFVITVTRLPDDGTCGVPKHGG